MPARRKRKGSATATSAAPASAPMKRRRKVKAEEKAAAPQETEAAAAPPAAVDPQDSDSDAGPQVLGEEGGMQPLWKDDGPTRSEYRNVHLRRGVRLATGEKPSWADPKKVMEKAAGGEDDDDSLTSEGEDARPERRDGEADDDEISEEAEIGDLFKKTGRLVSSTRRLPTGQIRFSKLQNVNRVEKSQAAVTDVCFHPSSSLVLTASPDHCVRFFQADWKSAKVQTVRFDDLPVRTAKFTPDGTRVICTADRPYYGVIDLASSNVHMVRTLSRFGDLSLVHADVSSGGARHRQGVMAFGTPVGEAHVVSAATHQVLFTVKGDGECRGVRFDADRDELWTLSGDKVYVWDIRTRRPLRIHKDEGAQTVSCLGITRDYYAIGSTNGVVNLYDRPSVWPGDPMAQAPKPKRSIESLVTATQFAKFNPDADFGSQVLCVGSAEKSNAVRMVHLPSASVFDNFPGFGDNHKYGRVTCCDFSPNSGLMCLGNAAGHAPLFRLTHYPKV